MKEVNLGILTGISYVTGIDYYKNINKYFMLNKKPVYSLNPNPKIVIQSKAEQHRVVRNNRF